MVPPTKARVGAPAGRLIIGGPAIPRGAVPLPTGGYRFAEQHLQLSRSPWPSTCSQVTGVVREPIDVERFARALLDVAEQLRNEDQDEVA